MTTVNVLRSGQLKDRGFGQTYAPSTVSLITCTKQYDSRVNDYVVLEKPRYILVDAGSDFDTSDDLKKWLEPYNVELTDIKNLVITHNDPDHTGLKHSLGNVRVCGPDSLYVKAKEPSDEHIYYAPLDDWSDMFSEKSDINIIKTGGHASSKDQSVLVQTPEGVVLICGDIFLNEAEYRNPDQFLWPPDNESLAIKSRQRIMNEINPDIIIPGHGDAFYTDILKSHLKTPSHNILS